MFDEEVAIARFVLCSKAIVFIVETAFANRIRPYVSHETMYLCIFYYLVANVASSMRQLPASSPSVWACLTRTALCSIPLTSLLSLLYNFRHSIVDCIVHDTLVGCSVLQIWRKSLALRVISFGRKETDRARGMCIVRLGTFHGNSLCNPGICPSFRPVLFRRRILCFHFHRRPALPARIIPQGSNRPPSRPRLTFNYFLSSFGVTALRSLFFGNFRREARGNMHLHDPGLLRSFIHHPSLSIARGDVARSEPGSPGTTICGFDLTGVLRVHGLYPKCNRASLDVRRIGGLQSVVRVPTRRQGVSGHSKRLVYHLFQSIRLPPNKRRLYQTRVFLFRSDSEIDSVGHRLPDRLDLYTRPTRPQ